jgi:hypothetical protein
MYIKFPRFDEELPPILRKLIPAMPGKDQSEEREAFVSELLFEQHLRKRFEEEAVFLAQIEDIMTRCCNNETLSDSQKQIFSTIEPFG